MADRSFNRRNFIKACGAAAVGLGAGPAFAKHEKKKKKPTDGRPNVLMICVDDLRPQLGCYGHKEMISPNIDRLASEGRMFNRHYVQYAACGPSRCSMLTGMREKRWDCWGEIRKSKVEPKHPASIGHHFRRNGYYTSCIGKVSHLPGGTMDKEQKIQQVPYSWDRSYTPVGSWKSPWGAFFSYDKGRFRAFGWDDEDNVNMPAYEAADVNDTGYADGLNAEEAMKQLRELKDRQFFLAVGFYKPHLPFNAPKKYWDLYDPEKLKLASNPFPPANVDPEISLHDSYELKHYGWAVKPEMVNKQEARTLKHAYYACVSYVDAQIGKVLDEVKRLGLDKNTIVVLWSDHGWHLGEHGIWGKATNHEIALRSPLIIKVPGMSKPGKSSGELVETVDLYPTLAELCGLDIPEGLAGRSAAGMVRDASEKGKGFVYSFQKSHKRELMGRTHRTDRYRIVSWVDEKGEAAQIELYDLENDPQENVNIAKDNPKIVEELLVKLQQIARPELEKSKAKK